MGRAKVDSPVTAPIQRDVDYAQPRIVWTPGSSPSGNDSTSPWWGQIPKLIQEDNDLTPLQRNVYGVLATRQKGRNGIHGYALHGKQFLADRIGMEYRRVHAAAKELERRGIIHIGRNRSRGNGEAAYEYDVLWAPQWRVDGDPEDKWNPPIILGPGKTAPSPRLPDFGAMGNPATVHEISPRVDGMNEIAPRVLEGDSVHGIAPRLHDGLCTELQHVPSESVHETAARPCTKAAMRGEILGSGSGSVSSSGDQVQGPERESYAPTENTPETTRKVDVDTGEILEPKVVTDAAAVVALAHARDALNTTTEPTAAPDEPKSLTAKPSTPTVGYFRRQSIAQDKLRQRARVYGLTDAQLYEHIGGALNIPTPDLAAFNDLPPADLTMAYEALAQLVPA